MSKPPDHLIPFREAFTLCKAEYNERFKLKRSGDAEAAFLALFRSGELELRISYPNPPMGFVETIIPTQVFVTYDTPDKLLMADTMQTPFGVFQDWNGMAHYVDRAELDRCLASMREAPPKPAGGRRLLAARRAIRKLYGCIPGDEEYITDVELALKRAGTSFSRSTVRRALGRQ